MIQGSNYLITGGQFNYHPYEGSIALTQSNISFEKLYQKSSPLAWHLANSDSAHSTCFLNTRVNVLGRIKDWVRISKQDESIMWLHGAAGGGKTSVARTIAKWCEEEQILLGEFFFSRADSGTQDPFNSFVPTLAFKMATHTCTEAKEAICNVINLDPHVFSASLANQLRRMVLEPLQIAAQNYTTPHVIIVDGLDETLSDEQQYLIIKVLFDAVYSHNAPLRILICSRPEPNIATTVKELSDSKKTISTIKSESLSDDPDSDSDIRRFLVEKFTDVRQALGIPPEGEWPSTADIDFLVAKASGQFIYAVTVEKYVSSRRQRCYTAVQRLQQVLGLRSLPRGATRPFADLDALYTLILNSRDDVNVSVKTMAICFEFPTYFNSISPRDLATVLDLDLTDAMGILYELASLLEVTEEKIRPYHASFADFLFDSSRSCDLYISRRDIVTEITCGMLTPRDPERLHYRAFFQLLKDTAPCQRLRDILTEMKPLSIFSRPPRGKPYIGSYYLVPLLKQLENHATATKYAELSKYFDLEISFAIEFGDSEGKCFSEEDSHLRQKPIQHRKGTLERLRKRNTQRADSHNSQAQIASGSGHKTDDHEGPDGGDDDPERRLCKKLVGPELASYDVSVLAPLCIYDVWDEVDLWSQIRLKGSDLLRGLCDEAQFVRKGLPNTTSTLRDQTCQERAAVFCIRELERLDIPDELHIVFAKFVPYTLSNLWDKNSSSLHQALQQFFQSGAAQAAKRKLSKEAKDMLHKYYEPFEKKALSDMMKFP